MADQDGKKGISGAHTGGDLPPDVEPDADQVAKIGDAAALGRSVLDDLAGQIGDGDDPAQSSLFEDEDCLFSGPVTHVAEKFETAKGAGRRRGSKNKANQQFREYILKQGYRHPGLNLADLANADPHELAAELSQPYRVKKGPHAGELVEASCTPADALELIRKANVELMPYFESKRPVEVDVTRRELGVLIFRDDRTPGEDRQTVQYEAIEAEPEKPDNSET